MAERRMFSKSITESDDFINLSKEAQSLYFHLCMYADDDGFINNAKSIIRGIDANNNEWIDIDESTFKIIQNEWRLFMQKNVDSYYEHLMITYVLNEEQMTI